MDRAGDDGTLSSMSVDALLRENEALREELAARDRRLAELEQELAALTKKLELTAKERALLESKLRELQALRQRVALLAPGQGVLEFDEFAEPHEPEPPEHIGEAPDGETPEDKIRQRHKPKGAARKLDISNLAIKHVYHELPEDERVCEVTGKMLIAVGEKLEDEIEYRRANIERIVHHQTVYGLSDEDAAERKAPRIVAPGPVRPIEGSIVGPLLLAWILVQKYAHHLPLYRQEKMLERDGLRVPRQTMCDWVMSAADTLGPIQQALKRRILATGVAQIDDTPVKCQGPTGHGIFQARLWTLTSPETEGVVYEFTEDRSHECILEILTDYEEGWLVGDGYQGHDAVVAERPGLAQAGCWAHAIRKFKDAIPEAPVLATEIVTTIAKLFDLEESARDMKPEERQMLRQKQAPAILNKLDELVTGWKSLYSESGSMGTACKYLENQRAPLRSFLEDGRLPIHNNACEVSIRPIAIGRKNWLFAGSIRGGHAAATIYTLVECCKLADVDPLEYLADVLVRVASHPASRVEELLPVEWKQRFTDAHAPIHG